MSDFEKFKKSYLSRMYNEFQALASAAISVTTSTKTIEKGNDLDSHRANEGEQVFAPIVKPTKIRSVQKI